MIFVTEILSSGTLKSFVQKVQLIRWKIFKRWTIQILKGLEYLHSQDPPIIHRDLNLEIHHSFFLKNGPVAIPGVSPLEDAVSPCFAPTPAELLLRFLVAQSRTIGSSEQWFGKTCSNEDLQDLNLDEVCLFVSRWSVENELDRAHVRIAASEI